MLFAFIFEQGMPKLTRAVINQDKDDNGYELLVEGYGLREVMTTDGRPPLLLVDGQI